MEFTRKCVLDERPISLGQAAREWGKRTGQPRLSATTVWRWARQGIAGVHLETVHFGGKTCTSIPALERFAARCASAKQSRWARRRDKPRDPPPGAPSRPGVDRALKRLRDAGVTPHESRSGDEPDACE